MLQLSACTSQRAMLRRAVSFGERKQAATCKTAAPRKAARCRVMAHKVAARRQSPQMARKHALRKAAKRTTAAPRKKAAKRKTAAPREAVRHKMEPAWRQRGALPRRAWEPQQLSLPQTQAQLGASGPTLAATRPGPDISPAWTR